MRAANSPHDSWFEGTCESNMSTFETKGTSVVDLNADERAGNRTIFSIALLWHTVGQRNALEIYGS